MTPAHSPLKCNHAKESVSKHKLVMKKLLWALNHAPTEEQKEEIAMKGYKIIIPEWLDKFRETPTEGDLSHLMIDFIDHVLAENVEIMAGPIGSPEFFFLFGQEAGWNGARKAYAYMYGEDTYRPFPKVIFAHSKRDSVDHIMPDGSVKKVAVFRHLGFSW